MSAPEIDVQGNGQSIPNGDTSPTTADDTDFGSITVGGTPLTHTFTISNSGLADLTLIGTPTITLTNSSAFTVTQPVSTTLAASESTTFTLTFAPQSANAFTNTVSIANNDSDENPYTFVISGTGYCPSPIYVDRDATTGNNDGTSWANAFTDLQDGLALARTCAPLEVWVATGVYTPGLSRSDTFTLTSGVQLYGGFAATETVRTERNWEANVTVLSGDIAGDDTIDANSVVTDTVNISGSNNYHVVWADGVTDPITASTVLDGFTITAGQADGSDPDSDGGGFYCDSNGNGSECSPGLSNVIFSGNWVDNDGGAMFNYAADNGVSSPSLNNVTFSGNLAGDDGGAMGNEGYNNGVSSPNLSNVTFFSNTTGDSGGAMFNYGNNGVSSPGLSNVTFSGNSTDDSGGALYNYGNNGVSSPSLVNVTFSGNVAADKGGGMSNYSNNGGASSPSLCNVTFSGNLANYGGAIAQQWRQQPQLEQRHLLRQHSYGRRRSAI